MRVRRTKADEDSYSVLDKSLGTIYIVGEVTQKQASQFRQQIRTLERLKRVTSVVVEINSPGGDIEAGLMIIDSIELCKKPVTTRVTGQAMSMGALILASGAKREAFPNASIMVHQGSYRITGAADELVVEYAECKRIEKLCWDFMDSRTGKTAGYWETLCDRKNLYLSAEQALSHNLVETILRKS